MDKDLAKIIKAYSALSHKDYEKTLKGCPQSKIAGMFTKLLTVYMTDKNSSTLREFLTVTMAGYKHQTKKIGYNGFKHSSAGKPISCEAKPKNVSVSDWEDYQAGKRGNFQKLNGSGNFTDYTFKRFRQDRKERINMLVSGFVDGQMLYLLEFPFTDSVFMGRLHQQLQKRFPNPNNKKPGEFLRSAKFNYAHYINSKGLKVVYCNKRLIEKNKRLIVLKFYKKLVELSERRENQK